MNKQFAKELNEEITKYINSSPEERVEENKKMLKDMREEYKIKKSSLLLDLIKELEGLLEDENSIDDHRN